MLPTRCCTAARPWEYRWRALILFGSQPVLAVGVWCAHDFAGRWWDVPVPFTVGLWAAALGIAGVLLRIWATGSMSAAVMASSTPSTDRLVDDGPYGLCRNSLYVGSMLIFGAYGLFFGWWCALAYFLFHWLRYLRIVAYEEQLLRARWGEKFDRYCTEVPRWVPRIHRLERNSLGSVSWLDGCLGNSVFAGIILGYVAAAWTGSLGALIPFEASGFVIAGLYLWYSHRQTASGVATSKQRVPVAAVSREAT